MPNFIELHISFAAMETSINGLELKDLLLRTKFQIFQHLFKRAKRTAMFMIILPNKNLHYLKRYQCL